MPHTRHDRAAEPGLPRLTSRAHALRLLAGLAPRPERGTVLLVCVDRRRRIVDLLGIAEGADHEVELVDLATKPGTKPEAAGLLLVTDRSGRVPLDRPGDTLVWEELVGLAAARGVRLLDWFVTADDRWAFSVAEHAPTPAAW